MDPEAFNEVVGYYGPGSITWRIDREAILLAGGGCAVLLQLAHPLVAAGVNDHSAYERDPVGRFKRTFALSNALVFGTRSGARQAAQTINQRHKSVLGTLDVQAGDFSAGASYRARDPDLLLWVHAGLVDTILRLYQLLVAPLTTTEQEHYYQESCTVARLLGLPPQHLPPTLAAFQDYMQAMLTGDQLTVTPSAKKLAHLVLHPRTFLPTRPFFGITAGITVGLLPPRLRQMYGYPWGARQQLLFNAWVSSTRRLLPLLPSWLREIPAARAANARLCRALVHEVA